MLRKILISLAALIGGFIAGIIVTEVLVFAFYMTTGVSSWMRALKYFPIMTALLAAAVVWIWTPAMKRGGQGRRGGGAA